MKQLHFRRHKTLASLLCLTAFTGTSWAQPDPDNAAKAENPVNRAPRALRRGQREQGVDPQLDRLRRQLRQLGLADLAQQDALVTYISGESQARETLISKGRDLYQKLRAPSLTDAQMLGLLNTYNAAVDDDQARRDAAVSKLQKSINFAKNPKVETYLTVLGLYGDGPTVINSIRTRQTFNFRGRGNFAIPVAPPVTAPGVKTPQTQAATAAVRG